MNTQQDETKQRPIQNFRDGAIQVAIWPRQSQNGVYYEIDRTRSYKDKDGQWQSTRLISERDMLKARRLEDQAYDAIQRLKEQNRALQQSERAQEQQQHSDPLAAGAQLAAEQQQAAMADVPAHQPQNAPELTREP